MTKTMIRTPIGNAELKRVYGGGKPIIKDGIPLLVRHLRKRLLSDQQNVIAIDGKTGTGKSNLAVHIATLLDPKWDIEKNYLYDDHDLKIRMRDVKEPYPVFLMDEGSIILNSKNSLCKSDKDIIKIFDTMRIRHITTIVCCPNAQRLNKTFLADHVDFRLLCPKKSPIKGVDPKGFVHVHGHWSATWTDSQSWPFMYTTSFEKMSKSYKLRYDELKYKSMERITKEIAWGDMIDA